MKNELNEFDGVEREGLVRATEACTRGKSDAEYSTHCRQLRLAITTSPGLHTIGNAPGILSPCCWTNSGISILPTRWDFGTTHTPFSAVEP